VLLSFQLTPSPIPPQPQPQTTTTNANAPYFLLFVLFHPRSSSGPASATNDITDDFAQVLNRAENNNAFAGLAGPGKWNDPDMLEVGNTLTDAEGRSHFSLWCLMKAPLLIGKL